MSWLDEITTAVAEATDQDASGLAVTPGDIAVLLDVARVAAHTSGDRTNAPVLCYVLGIARSRGASLEDLAAAVRAAAGDGES